MKKTGRSAKETRRRQHGQNANSMRKKPPDRTRGYGQGTLLPSKDVLLCSCSGTSPPPDNLPQPAPLHPIDQAVRDIAKDFRFTVEEVQEYYDKCGDAERTRNRFKRMRDVLNALKDEDDGLSGSTAATAAPST